MSKNFKRRSSESYNLLKDKTLLTNLNQKTMQNDQTEHDSEPPFLIDMMTNERQEEYSCKDLFQLFVLRTKTVFEKIKSIERIIFKRKKGCFKFLFIFSKISDNRKQTNFGFQTMTNNTQAK